MAVNDGGGGVVAVTRKGPSEVQYRDVVTVSPKSQAPSTAAHARAVSWVAAWAEVRGHQWFGPADIARDGRWTMRREDGARHRPDLVFEIDGRFVAIEVELHSKGPRRLQAILRAYRQAVRAGDLWNVAYIVDKDSVHRLVDRQIEELGLERAVAATPLQTVINATQDPER